MYQPALLALADGNLFRGASIGVSGQTVGEVVFNTAMTGYQEILTDPSYSRQIVTFTYPHIGNTGANPDDEESSRVYASGLIVREPSPIASSWRAQERLEDYLLRHEVVGIAGIDTRRLTRLLREGGAQSGCIMAGEHIDEHTAIEMARAFPGLNGMDLARVVSTEIRYEWAQGSWTLEPAPASAAGRTQPYHVVAYDYGVKRNILCLLVDRGCRVTVVPAQTPVQDVLALKPHGVFLSNGPGDPAACSYAIESIRVLLERRVPLFGICLGHQLLGLASGGRTIKMKFGHHGANHPVLDLDSKRVMITSQNHGFAVDEATMPSNLRVTHRSLFDGSNQGIHRTDVPAFGFQGHPEASPGPHDAAPLLDHFIELMRQHAR
ncbi:MAG: glutamine-hydrolyzing carbamoyl-phosphate synthase small subunit [Gammaproteobacteria bacterium]|nr:glutamine-hydrolyzing carbamoyl-phosphate synthase small subunit [Gammaproteobacteria bacterium]